jgi:hypothetical protein
MTVQTYARIAGVLFPLSFVAGGRCGLRSIQAHCVG